MGIRYCHNCHAYCAGCDVGIGEYVYCSSCAEERVAELMQELETARAELKSLREAWVQK